MITAFLLLALCVVLYIFLLVEGECWLSVVVEQVLLDWFVSVALVALCLSVVADDDDLPVTAPSLLLLIGALPLLL